MICRITVGKTYTFEGHTVKVLEQRISLARGWAPDRVHLEFYDEGSAPYRLWVNSAQFRDEAMPV